MENITFLKKIFLWYSVIYWLNIRDFDICEFNYKNIFIWEKWFFDLLYILYEKKYKYNNLLEIFIYELSYHNTLNNIILYELFDIYFQRLKPYNYNYENNIKNIEEYIEIIFKKTKIHKLEFYKDEFKLAKNEINLFLNNNVSFNKEKMLLILIYILLKNKSYLLKNNYIKKYEIKKIINHIFQDSKYDKFINFLLNDNRKLNKFIKKLNIKYLLWKKINLILNDLLIYNSNFNTDEEFLYINKELSLKLNENDFIKWFYKSKFLLNLEVYYSLELLDLYCYYEKLLKKKSYFHIIMENIENIENHQIQWKNSEILVNIKSIKNEIKIKELFEKKALFYRKINLFKRF